MTQRQSRHGPGRHQPGGGAPHPPPAPDREAAGGRRRQPLRRADHRQGHREVGRCAARDQGCEGRLRVAAATTVGDKGFARSEALIDAGCDCIVIDTAHGHNLEVAARGRAGEGAVELGPGDRRQRRHRRSGQGAGRCRRRRDQGRHRPRLDLHHADRRRGRRAAADRDHGGGGAAAKRRAGHRRRRHPHQRRHRQGARRGRLDGDGRLAARRDRGSAGRDLPLPGPHLQILSRHGLGRGDGPRLGRPLFPAGHPGPAEAGSRRDRGAGAVQGPGARHRPPAGRRGEGGDGLHRLERPSPSCRSGRGSSASPMPACAKAMSTTSPSPARRPTIRRVRP